MTVGILLITHGRVGQGMLETAGYMLDELPTRARSLNVDSNRDPDELDARARELIATLDDGDGVLVLTDLVGSTPGNVASRLASEADVRVVAGLNLPMLIKVMNYATLALDELAIKAINGGKQGILPVEGP